MTRVMLLSAVFVATTTVAADAVNALLATNPVTEAEQAFAAGDRRYIVVPVCAGGGDVLPGWPLTYSPAHLEAIEKGKKPITCTDIGDDPEWRTFVRVSKHAEQYNQRLLQLSAKGRK